MTTTDTAAPRSLPWTTTRPRRLVASVGAGLAISAGVPPWGWWPLTMAGIAVWVTLLAGAPARSRAVVSAGVGLGWFLPSTLWMVKFTPAAWPFGVALWFPFVAAAFSLLVNRERPATGLAAALILSEWFRWHAPFGGVPLSMLAMTQADAPLLPTARVAGSLGVSAAVACLGAALGAAMLADRSEQRRNAALAAVGVLGIAALGVVAPDGHADRTIDVAAIQGGGPQETRSENTDYDVVLTRHLDRARTVEEPVDLVVLPENIVNINGYFEGSTEQERLTQLAIAMDATVIAGVVEDESDPDYFRNAVVSIAPDGTQTGRYDKVRRVPFGEYIPLRPFFESIAADQLFARDAIPGIESNVLETPAGRTGIAISWEVFFPRRIRAAVHDGSEIILNPTNGASYWLTEVQTQQIASSRLRSVEAGQWVVQAAPTGFSAIIDPAGNVIQRTGIGESDALVGTVEMRRGRTWASYVGATPALLLAALLLTLSWTGAWNRRLERD